MEEHKVPQHPQERTFELLGRYLSQRKLLRFPRTSIKCVKSLAGLINGRFEEKNNIKRKKEKRKEKHASQSPH